MKISVKLNYLMLLLMLFMSAITAQPLPVFVEAREIGQGIAFNRMGACYLVTPAHVIDGSFFATVIAGLPAAPKGDGDVLMTFGYDLSLLRITGGVSNDCNFTFRSAGGLDSMLASTSIAHLLTVRSDGSVGRQPLGIADTGMIYIYVQPMPGDEPLMKGMSGSMLEASGKPLGMLMSVDPESGHGKVLRYDRLTETVAPFFRGKAAAPPSVDNRVVAGASAVTKANGAAVTRWTSPPLGADFRAKNLLDGQPESIWQARVKKFPVDIEIEMAAGKSMVLNAVELVSAGVIPRERTPRDYEIMVSNKVSGGWIPLTSGTLFTKDDATLVAFVPVRAKRLLVRFHSNWGDTEAVGLSEIRLR